MRGKLFTGPQGSGKTRITPAYAGKTESTMQTHRQKKDHPRVCGENAVKITEAENGEGSPPRMRGKRTEFETGAVRDRITPAYAGKTVRPVPNRVN